MESPSTSNIETAVVSSDKRPELLFPFLDLRAQFATIREETISAVTEVLESQELILGQEVDALEREVSQMLACQFAVGCASGTDALSLALMALAVGPGDEVVTTPFTFVATAGSIARLGARPVFVDIDSETYALNPSGLEQAITARTKAIIPVHLFGLPADMHTIEDIARRRKVAIVEDAAQAMGAKYLDRAVGTLGAFGCFSFFPSKNLGAAGDGGMIVTNDPVLADRLKMLRVHGSRKKYHHELLGMNSRLDALQAAILRVKLCHLEEWTVARRRNAEGYRQLFKDYGLDRWIGLPSEPPDRLHVYNQYVIRAAHRDALQEHLRNAGIPTEIYYPAPLHLQPAFGYLGHHEGDFPQAELASQQVLALPVYPELKGEHQHAVAQAIADFVRKPR
jgi:dTDP-4-amino-4,6-dideoxygalactose transaminase